MPQRPARDGDPPLRAGPSGARPLTAGWATDLAILRHTGSQIDDRGDHLVVRTPRNPTFHWGNFVLVTEPAAADDAERWHTAFTGEFPAATHVALGLPRLPLAEPYLRLGLDVGTDEVLTTTTLPEQRPLSGPYAARPFAGAADWSALLAVNILENRWEGTHPVDEHAEFLRAQQRLRQEMVGAGLAQWFGAVDADGTLAAYLGIVVCGELGRYQAVGTPPAHRRRGLAGHLLGLAARWAYERGVSEWVIVTETVNPAGRLYRGVGFVPDAVQVSAYRHA